MLPIFAGVSLLLTLGSPFQEEAPTEEEMLAYGVEFQAELSPTRGQVAIRGRLAELMVPVGYEYLEAADAQHLLENGWGNPPDPTTLGMLIPEGFNLFADDSWGVVVSYDDDGHVDDADASSIDYAEMLEDMQDDIEDSNDDRIEAGYGSLELIGWATSPRYDSSTKKMYWAKEISFDGSPEHTLNYDIRVLGREGVLVLSAVGNIDQLAMIEGATPAILDAFEFTEGNRYEDFDPSTDNLAAYGIGGLIAGKLALKVGLFKGLWIALLAGKKFVIIAVIAIAAFVKRIISGRKRETSDDSA